MVNVLYSLNLDSKQFLFSKKYSEFVEDSTNIRQKVADILNDSGPLLTFKDHISGKWTNISVKNIKDRGVIQVEKIQEGC